MGSGCRFFWSGCLSIISAPTPPAVPCCIPRSKEHKSWPMPPLRQRKYDVTFIGRLEYEAKDAVSGVTAHR